MATGLHGVFAKAAAAKEVILSVKPKLTLATDRTSIETVMTALKGSDIASDTGSQTLEKITAASANLDTDLLREQQGQAIRILCEGWTAFLRKLGVSVHMDSAIPIMEKLTICLETQGPEEMPDTKAKWKQNIEVLKLAYAVSKKFTCYLSLVEPRAPRDPGATLLKALQKAHNGVQQKLSTVTVTEKVQISELNDFLQRLRNTIKADGLNHVQLQQTAIEAEFDKPYNGEGSYPLIKILGGQIDGKGWLDQIKEKEKLDAKTLIQLARGCGLLHRSDKAFTAHTNKIMKMLCEVVNVAKDFSIDLDETWKKKWAGMVKTGQVTQLERKIIDVVINHHKKARDMGVQAKHEYAKFAKHFQDAMHPAMKKLYNLASGARSITNLGELSIENKDPDPVDPSPPEEGEDAGGEAAVDAAAPVDNPPELQPVEEASVEER